jgi:hypothetical protein
LLDTLDSIPWGALNGCYRPAAELPECLRSLLSPVSEIRQQAIEEIGSAIFHQGTVYEVTPVVVPFLFELLENDGVQGKENIVCLITALAHCHCMIDSDEEECKRLDAVFRNEGSSFEAESRRQLEWVRVVKSTIANRFDTIYPYLRYPDDFYVRLSVAEALVRFPEIVERLRPDLEKALESETDEYVRDMLGAVLTGECE